GREEICSEERAPVGAQERAPRHRPLTARWNALVPQDLGDGRARDAMAQVLERALDRRIAPARIIGRHPDHKAADFHLHAGSAEPRRRVRPLSGNQLAMPPENRVWRHDCGDVPEHPTAQALADDGESSTFIATQPYPSTTQLPLQDAILFPKKFD